MGKKERNRKRIGGRHKNESRLTDLQPGDEAVISGLNEEAADMDRLRELGLNDGVQLRVVKYAPMGDPIEIKVRGFHLSLRKSMANKIRVKKHLKK